MMGPQNLNRSRSLQGWFVICRLELAIINLFAELEISSSTSYDNMESDKVLSIDWFGVVGGRSMPLKITLFATVL